VTCHLTGKLISPATLVIGQHGDDSVEFGGVLFAEHDHLMMYILESGLCGWQCRLRSFCSTISQRSLSFVRDSGAAKASKFKPAVFSLAL
jgi:hypothetical protein